MVAGVERVRCNEAADFVRTKFNLHLFLYIQQFIKLLKLKKKDKTNLSELVFNTNMFNILKGYERIIINSNFR